MKRFLYHRTADFLMRIADQIERDRISDCDNFLFTLRQLASCMLEDDEFKAKDSPKALPRNVVRLSEYRIRREQRNRPL